MTAPAACGVEWLVDAYGCDPARLADLGAMRALFDRLVADLALRPVAPPVWHQFPPPSRSLCTQNCPEPRESHHALLPDPVARAGRLLSPAGR